jgi:hypothetical protein
VCGRCFAVQTLFVSYGVDGFAAVQLQQDASTLSGSPVAAMLNNVGQLLALSFKQNKGAGFVGLSAILRLATFEYQLTDRRVLTLPKNLHKPQQLKYRLLHCKTLLHVSCAVGAHGYAKKYQATVEPARPAGYSLEYESFNFPDLEPAAQKTALGQGIG